MSDVAKLRMLANWFDAPEVQKKHPEWSDSDEVQQDLRQIADEIERLQEDLADAHLALSVHSGKRTSAGLSDEDKQRIVRALQSLSHNDHASKETR